LPMFRKRRRSLLFFAGESSILLFYTILYD
jgi:hypothetical protein